jgi:hypothetical protein
VAFPFANGTRAVIEERPGGTDVWASILHLRRRQRPSAPTDGPGHSRGPD